MSGATPLMTNTFSPTGGVIRPISRTITMMTPNQIILNSRAWRIGKRMGTMRIMIAKLSMMQPRMIKATIMASRTIGLGIASFTIVSAMIMGIFVKARNEEKIFAPIIIKKIMAVIFPVATRLSINDRMDSCRLIREMTNAPNAPIPAASVGVKIPKYIPPMTIIKRVIMGQVP